MIPVQTAHSAGTVAVVTGSMPRYFEFWDSLVNTYIPPNTKYLRASSYNVVMNRNAALEKAVGDWVWFLDDDHVWDHNVLLRLLDHNVDVVGPLVTYKVPPFHSQLFKSYDAVTYQNCQGYTWKEVQAKLDSGITLLDVPSMGTPGLLVRRHVWEALAKEGPPFIWPPYVNATEDTLFTYRCHKMGFKVCCDLTIPFPHVSTMAASAEIDHGALGLYVTMNHKKIAYATIERTDSLLEAV